MRPQEVIDIFDKGPYAEITLPAKLSYEILDAIKSLVAERGSFQESNKYLMLSIQRSVNEKEQAEAQVAKLTAENAKTDEWFRYWFKRAKELEEGLATQTIESEQSEPTRCQRCNIWIKRDEYKQRADMMESQLAFLMSKGFNYDWEQHLLERAGLKECPNSFLNIEPWGGKGSCDGQNGLPRQCYFNRDFKQCWDKYFETARKENVVIGATALLDRIKKMEEALENIIKIESCKKKDCCDEGKAWDIAKNALKGNKYDL